MVYLCFKLTILLGNVIGIIHVVIVLDVRVLRPPHASMRPLLLRKINKIKALRALGRCRIELTV